MTIVPYHLGEGIPGLEVGPDAELVPTAAGAANGRKPRKERKTIVADDVVLPGDCQPIDSVEHRRPARIGGRVQGLRVQPRAGVATLEVTLADPTGAMTIVFLGRRSIPGIVVGTKMVVDGTVGDHHGHQAMLNPSYEILEAPELPPVH